MQPRKYFHVESRLVVSFQVSQGLNLMKYHFINLVHGLQRKFWTREDRGCLYSVHFSRSWIRSSFSELGPARMPIYIHHVQLRRENIGEIKILISPKAGR